MVASHRPGSRTARSGSAMSGSAVSGSAVPRPGDRRVPVVPESRPRLRLVVDNTASPVESSSRRTSVSAEPSGPPASLGAECAAWMWAAAGLVSARWRLARQQWINRYGSFGMAARTVGLGPVVMLAVVGVFGGLLAVRLAQEGSSTASSNPASVVASAVAPVAEGIPSPADVESARNVGGDAAVVVVHPGDSLWSIAVNRYPERDPRSVVEAFVEVNGGSAIRPGQQLVIPAGLLGN